MTSAYHELAHDRKVSSICVSQSIANIVQRVPLGGIASALTAELCSRCGLTPGGSFEESLALLKDAVGAPSSSLCGYVFKEVRK